MTCQNKQKLFLMFLASVRQIWGKIFGNTTAYTTYCFTFRLLTVTLFCMSADWHQRCACVPIRSVEPFILHLSKWSFLVYQRTSITHAANRKNKTKKRSQIWLQRQHDRCDAWRLYRTSCQNKKTCYMKYEEVHNLSQNKQHSLLTANLN